MLERLVRASGRQIDQCGDRGRPSRSALDPVSISVPSARSLPRARRSGSVETEQAPVQRAGLGQCVGVAAEVLVLHAAQAGDARRRTPAQGLRARDDRAVPRRLRSARSGNGCRRARAPPRSRARGRRRRRHRAPRHQRAHGPPRTRRARPRGQSTTARVGPPPVRAAPARAARAARACSAWPRARWWTISTAAARPPLRRLHARAAAARATGAASAGVAALDRRWCCGSGPWRR